MTAHKNDYTPKLLQAKMTANLNALIGGTHTLVVRMIMA
jgi:hypothetical protein